MALVAETDSSRDRRQGQLRPRYEPLGPVQSPGFADDGPIGICYIGAARAQGGISRSDWVKTAAATVGFLVFGVAAPNLALRTRNSPYEFSDRQMGPYLSEDAEVPGGGESNLTTGNPTDHAG